MESVGGVLAGVVAAVTSVLGAIVTWRKARSEANQQTAQRAEDAINRRDEEIASKARIIKEQDHDLEVLRARESLMREYVFLLQWHIINNLPPPPPPWPERLGPREGI